MSDDVGAVAWYYDNSYALGPSHPDYGPHQVGTEAPNELDIYDMAGNLTERVWDYYAAGCPAGPLQGADVGPAGEWIPHVRREGLIIIEVCI